MTGASLGKREFGWDRDFDDGASSGVGVAVVYTTPFCLDMHSVGANLLVFFLSKEAAIELLFWQQLPRLITGRRFGPPKRSSQLRWGPTLLTSHGAATLWAGCS
jgi:hypothetical protein